MKAFMKNKNGMEVGGLYQFVLMIVLIGIILGVGVLILGNMAASTGVVDTETANVLNNITGALKPLATTWIPLIVTIAALVVILVMVIRGLGANMGR